MRKGRVDGRKKALEGKCDVEKTLEEGKIESLGKEGVEGEVGREDHLEEEMVDRTASREVQSGSSEVLGELGGKGVHDRV